MFIRPPKDEPAVCKIAALDALGANVMLADDQLRITYMNGAATALMRDAEADLVKELAHFSVDKLIGSNIDVFHKNPKHQRTMLSVLDKPHQATIAIGKRIFDLLVTPLADKGRRTGFVVEWSDATHRLLSVDYAAQIDALGRNQSVVEVGTDGIVLTANDNFLGILGYSIEEVRGRHHSMFVEPGHEKTPEYANFWSELKKGRFQTGRFKRFGKNGKVTWIEGSYNPILDRNGNVTKVVKFATEISGQMQLLADLNAMGEAIEQSRTGVEATTRAADATAENVSSVSASADELAASIGEIAENTARSREGAEEAFNQAAVVGQNTERLAAATREMNGIAGLIRDIASQINLLALNATIEAARAGDAGRGFAVVASEVKNLAGQAARATEQITKEINAIQSTSAEVATSMESIRDSVTAIREQIIMTATAIEEQSMVTKGMSASMRTASERVAVVSENMTGVSDAVRAIADAVDRTRNAAQVLAR